VENSTLTNNTASERGGGIYRYGGTLNFKNTIVAGNNGPVAYKDCDGWDGLPTSQGYNLTGVGTGCPYISTDLRNDDPQLDPLWDNGGPPDGSGSAPHTYALLSGSPALDAIPERTNGCGNTYTRDQRGAPRPINGACDIGAYEAGAAIWDDGGSGSNWSTAANWSEDTAPGASSVVVFNDTSDANAIMDAAFTVARLLVDAGYDGAINAGGYSLRVNGPYEQAGGTFTAPAGLMAVSGGFSHSGGTFDPNGGRVVLDNTSDQTLSTTFYDLVINDGLLGYWKLDDGTGTTAADASGYGRNGTLTNSPTWSADTPTTMDFSDPYSLSFDRSDNDYVSIAGTPDIDGLQRLTLATWVKLDSTPSGYMRFITLGNNKAGLRYHDQDLQFYVTINGGVYYATKTNALTSGTWYHVAGTYDGSQMLLYLNGVEQAGPGISGTVAAGDGVELSGPSSFTLDGWLDDARVYNRALSATEIEALANGEHPETYQATTSLDTELNVSGTLTLNSGRLEASPSLGGYWKFDEGSGTDIGDSSGNGHFGELIDGPTWTSTTAPTSFDNPYALAFDGLNDRVLITTGFERPEAAFTYALWFQPGSDWTAAFSRKDLLYGRSSAEARPAMIFNFGGEGKIGLYTGVGGSDQDNIKTTTTAWTSGTWYHIAFTWDGSQAIVYVNGVQEGDPFPLSGFHSASSGMSIGAKYDGANPVDGRIDDVRVYNQALSAAQVQTLASGGEVFANINLAGDFIRNGGVFAPRGGTVTFGGSGSQTLDTDTITFYDLTVNSGSTLVDAAEFTVTNTLTNTGTLQRTQEVTGTSPVNFFNTGGYGGLTLNANDTNLGSTTVKIRGNQDCTTGTSGSSVRRCFDIAPETTSGLDATMRLYFSASELGDTTCSSMQVWRWNGSAWVTAGTSPSRQCTTEPYYVEVTGVSSFSPFVGDNDEPGGNPTAVTLRSLIARSGLETGFLGATWFLGVLAALGAVGGMLVWVRRR